MTRATYNTDNTITEVCEMQKPRPPFDGIFSQYWEIHKKRMAAYEKEVAKCRRIPCSPECRGLWAEGQVLEEGRDYEVRGVMSFDENDNALLPYDKAFPLPVKSEDDLWEEVLTKIHMKALAYVSVGGHPHPGLPNHDPWHKEMIEILKKSYSLTKT